MADLLRFRRAATDCVFWARELRRAALLLAASVALFWSSLATGRWIVPIPDSGPIFGDVLIGRVAGCLEPRCRYLADTGAFVLFAVAAATTVLVLQNPGASAFVQAWSLGLGILPGAALAGYAMIAVGMTAHLAPITSWIPTRTRQRVRGSSTERSIEVFR